MHRLENICLQKTLDNKDRSTQMPRKICYIFLSSGTKVSMAVEQIRPWLYDILESL